MSVLDFEAYRLEYYIEGEGEYDENGDLQQSAGRWHCVGRVNAVPAGSRNLISLPDGSIDKFSFTISVHNPACREFKYGEKLRLTTIKGMEKYVLTVKHFQRYQHQCKIYA